MTEKFSATTLPTPGLLVQDQRLHQLLSSHARAFRPGALLHFAGVAQPVEHLFCKQVVRGSSPLASSAAPSRSTFTEGCPSGQREQAVNLPAMPSLVRIQHPPPPARRLAPPAGGVGFVLSGRHAPPRPAEVNSAGPHPTRRLLGRGFGCRSSAFLSPSVGAAGGSRRIHSAGVAQLVERQPSKLNVAGSNPVSRSM